jgi:hypothetical protein
MINFREDLLNASKIYFESQIKKHKINVEILLDNGVGVAEHPDVMETIEKELDIIASFDEKLSVIKKYF